MPELTSPTVADLSALMRARTEGELSFQGEFNDETRPTDVEAQEMIDLAKDIVETVTGPDIPTSRLASAKRAILLKAAVLVETSYYPEQANDENSAYTVWQAQYVELRDSLIAALNDNQPNRIRWASVPVYGREGVDPTTVV